MRYWGWVIAVVATSLFAAPAPAAEVLAVVVSAKSDITDITKADLKNIFLGKRKSWPSGDKAIPINLPAKTPVRVLFDKTVLEMSADEAGRYWVGQKIRAKAKPPKSVPSADLVKKLVAALPGAVGYIPASALDSSVRAISVNGVEHTKPSYAVQKK